MSVLLRRYCQLLNNSLISKWMSDATMETIRGMFLDNGVEVIKATNAYLNDIASMNIVKATALAKLINEDPMIICSLRLHPQGVNMPIRWLVGDGKAWINTLVIGKSLPELGMRVKIKAYRTNTSNGALLGARDPRFWPWLWFGGKWDNAVGDDNYGLTVQANKIYEVEWYASTSGWESYINGLLTMSGAHSVNTNRNMYMYANNAGVVTYQAEGHIAYVVIEDGTDGSFVKTRDFISMKLGKTWAAEDVSTGVTQAAGTCGMIDLVSGKFFPNANSQGLFTIEYTLPDGTPWTPGTPIP